MKIESAKMLPGRHRAGHCTALELVLSCAPETAAALRRHADALGAWATSQLAGTLDAEPAFDAAGALAQAAGNPLEDLACCHAALALWLQRAGGHEARWFAVIGSEGEQSIRYCLEYDHHEVAASACALALRLVAGFLRTRGVEPGEYRAADAPAEEPLPQTVAGFAELARAKALPLDTTVLIDIARERDIPWMKGDRPPFESLSTQRVRRNGALRLGYGNRQHVLDGTLCLDRAGPWPGLLDDLEAMYRLLEEVGAPLPERAACSSPLRARRSAHALGYPVAVRPRSRRVQPVRRHVDSDAALEQALDPLRTREPGFVIERDPAGALHHLVVANNRLAAVLAEGRPLDIAAVHPELLALVARLCDRLALGVFQLDVIAPDIAVAPAAAGTRVVDLSLAPELDRLIADRALHRRVLESYMQWLFPPGHDGRIPLVAITGTNGKTTTTRMIDAVLRAAGHRTGMACTDGVFIAGQTVNSGDSAGSVFHYQVLQDLRISHAVLETARGAVADFGFAYDACDVAVCTNVTAEHLGQFGIQTVEDMARLKQCVLHRARRGVVLNADDAHARTMSVGLQAPVICWSSTTQPVAQLAQAHRDAGAAAAGKGASFVVVEPVEGVDWIILYTADGATRTPVMAVDAIPATFAGRAAHNLSNALQAVAAAQLLGAPIDAARRALGSFSTSWDNTPGRLNIVREQPFAAIIDYAHNPDCYRALVAFIDRWPAAGRKILMVGCPGRSSRQAVRDIAGLVAGHFDLFVSRDSRELVGYTEGELPALVRDELIAHGVAADAVSVVLEQGEAIGHALALAGPGDLVVLCTTASMKESARQQILACCAGQDGAEEMQAAPLPHATAQPPMSPR
jgi:UDP-N-acetylmuramyl tripeptide synthase